MRDGFYVAALSDGDAVGLRIFIFASFEEKEAVLKARPGRGDSRRLIDVTSIANFHLPFGEREAVRQCISWARLGEVAAI